MSTIQEAIKSVQNYGDNFTKALERHRGFLGDGDGTVYVADRDGYVYVRHRQAESADITGTMEPEEVIYARSDIPPIEGYPVIFGRDIDTEDFQLLATDSKQLLGWIFDKYIKDHHEQHEFNEYDTVWIQKQAMLPLLVYPTSPVSTTLNVHQGWYQWDTDWHFFETTTSAELSSYIPVQSGKARFLLICIDGETETLHYESGDTFIIFLPPRDCEDRIPPPPEGKIPLAAIYLPYGTTSFDWDIIYDVRLLFSGGGSMSTGSAPRDAAYVTLAYNDILSAERLLSAGHGIVVTDNGANDTVEISVDSAADYNWSGDHNFNAGEMGLPSGTSFPANPQDGDVFYRTDEDNLYVYNGATWVEVGILVHNDLTGLQGGLAPDEYYHLDLNAYEQLSGGGAGVLPLVADEGYALVSDGVNSWAADLTPLWKGRHSFEAGITFAGGAGVNSVVIPDGLTDAFDITNGIEFLRLDTDNNFFLIDPALAGIAVGIGTANPGGRLHIYGESATTDIIIDCQGDTDDEQASLHLLTLGDGTKNISDAATKGWEITGRGNAWATAADQNELIFSFWDGAAFHIAAQIDPAGLVSVFNGISFEGATGNNEIFVLDNRSIALELLDAGGLEYLRINSENANPYFLIDPGAAGILTGIGLTAPVYKLEVHDGAANETVVTAFANTTAKTWNGTTILDTVRLRSKFTGQASIWDAARITWGWAAHYNVSGARFGIDVLNSSAAWLNAVTIKGNRKVGFGTLTPVATLDMVQTADAVADGFRIQDTAGIRFFSIGYVSPRYQLGTTYNAAWSFIANSIEHVTLATDGKVGIGVLVPTATLDMMQTADALADGFRIQDTAGIRLFSVGYVSPRYLLGTTYNAAWGLIANSIEHVILSAAGTVTISNLGGGGDQDVGADNNGLLYVPFVSDRKLKDNIEPLTGGLEVVRQLRGVTYDWKPDELAKVGLDFGECSKQVGLVAQEVVKVIPLAANQGKSYQSYRKEAITPFLIEAIKELDVRLTKLEAA